MVGRTPEYLGKKIEAFEVKMAESGASHFAREHSDLRCRAAVLGTWGTASITQPWTARSH